MLIRRELPIDVPAIREVTLAAYTRSDSPDALPHESGLVDLLRASDAWIPALSLVAVGPDGAVIGHVLGSRGWVGTIPALALAPVSVRPDQQRRGVGRALMHAQLGAADALDEELMGMLGDPGYFTQFGFRPAEEYGIAPPRADWQSRFLVRPLTEYDASVRGTFTYPEAFTVV